MTGPTAEQIAAEMLDLIRSGSASHAVRVLRRRTESDELARDALRIVGELDLELLIEITLATSETPRRIARS